MGASITDLLGGAAVLQRPMANNLDLARAIREGLPSAAAIALAHEILEGQPGADAMVAGFLAGYFGRPFSPDTSEQFSSRLTVAESDLVVRTASVLSKAIDILGEKSKAVHWIQSPNRALGGLTPLSLLDTSAGEHEVEALLDRIEYGVYS